MIVSDIESLFTFVHLLETEDLSHIKTPDQVYSQATWPSVQVKHQTPLPASPFQAWNNQKGNSESVLNTAELLKNPIIHVWDSPPVHSGYTPVNKYSWLENPPWT